jgi:hypothetical protein
VGGLAKEYPFVTSQWTGDKVGDLFPRREGEPDVPVAAAAGGVCHSWHGQGADRQS